MRRWPTFLSSNDVLTALLGVCIERARGENGVDVSSPSRHMTFAVNFRNHLTTLPDHSLGNTVFQSRVYFQIPVYELPDLDLLGNLIHLHPLQGSGIDTRSLLEIANQAFQSGAGILAYDDASLRSWMAFITMQPDYESMNLRYGDTIASSWRDLKINSLDWARLTTLSSTSVLPTGRAPYCQRQSQTIQRQPRRRRGMSAFLSRCNI